MTPATTAIVTSLPVAKQGVASAVNDTAREVGGALGIAVLGSAFTTAYRSDITDHLDGLSSGHIAHAREAPALALQIAHQLGADGNRLVAATQNAFETGLRAAVVISAVLFGVAALYTWRRGQDTTAPPTRNDFVDVSTGDLQDIVLEPATQ
jgi:hypothetical protein